MKLLILSIALMLTQCAQETSEFDDSKQPGGSAQQGSDDVVAAGKTQDATQTPSSGGYGPGSEPGKKDPKKPSTPVTTEKTFSLAVYGDSKQNYDPRYPEVATDLTLAYSYTQITDAFSQILRPARSDLFTQGVTGTSTTETFKQSDAGVLDILIVVDNSSSMKNEHDKLGQKLLPLISQVNFTDWQIGIVTTDQDDTCLRNIIRKGDPSPQTTFYNIIDSIGTKGDRDEKGILMARRSIEGTCLSAPWIRENSNLAILFLSDEDNCGDGDDDCKGAPYQSYRYLTDYLSTIRTLGDDAKIYGLITIPGDDACLDADGRHFGYIYKEAIDFTGGTAGSICSSSYDSFLSEMSLDMSNSLNIQFSLRHTPLAGSLTVTIAGDDWTPYVTVNGNTVTFSKVPPSNADIAITYTYGSSIPSDRFTLSSKAYRGSLEVRIDGVVTNSFQLDSNGRTVVFAPRPADRADIVVTYTEDIALKDRFNLSGQGGRDFRVSVGATETNAFTYDSGSNQMILSPPPEEGARITVTYEAQDARITSYPFNIPAQVAHTLRAETSTGGQVAVSHGAGYLDVGDLNFQQGDVLQVYYRDPAAASGTITLAQDPIPGSLTYELKDSSCEASDLSQEGNMITVDCLLSSGETIGVSYRYLVQVLDRIEVTEVTHISSSTWTVWVDGKIFDDYVRKKNVLFFPESVDKDAVIRVKVDHFTD